MAKQQGLGQRTRQNNQINPSLPHYQLQVLNEILQALGGGGVSATESTLNSVLSAIYDNRPDIEILLVRDPNAGNIVIKQVTDYRSDPKIVTYELVDGTPYVPTVVGDLEYLDASAVLNLILTELQTKLDVNLSTRASETTLSSVNVNVSPVAGRTHNTIVATANSLEEVPAGSLRGSVFNAGSADGTWNGITIPAGVSIGWGDVGARDTYNAIPYNADGATTLIIEYTT